MTVRTIIDVRSLRFRLLLLAAATIGLTLVVAGLSVKVLFEQHMQRRLAGELDTRLVDLAGSVALDADGRVTFAKSLADPRYAQPLSGAYWQVAEEGQKLLRSRSLWDRTLPQPPAPPPAGPYEIEAEDGAELYVLARPMTFGPEGATRGLTLMVALDHRELAALSDAFGNDLNWALAAIALALFAGAFLQTSVGLAPLRRLHASIQNVRTGDAARLLGPFPSEVQPLADDLNSLLDHHELSVQKARERAGTLAHGFKTPLTILTLEARKLDERGEGTAAQTLREQTETMRRHVERELNRARIRGGAIAAGAVGAGAGADLANEAGRLVDLVRRMPRSDRLTFGVDVDPGLSIRMDRHDFGEVLGNLLDNARKWASSRVDVRAERIAADMVRLDVCDDGPGFDVSSAVADGDKRKGSGLGLTIVADVLEAYGASFLAARENGRTVISVRLAARPAPDARAGRAGAARADMDAAAATTRLAAE